jgi:hypothetical protein
MKRLLVMAVLVVTALGFSVTTGASASGTAAYSPVDFSSQANFSWVAPQTDPNGAMAAYFPGGPLGSVTLGGIPFNILSNAAGFQAWNGWVASGGGSGTVSMTIPVNDYGATDVYTLINTYWGASGSYTALVFTGSGGATYTDNLVANSDIRNWCCGGSINGTSTINVYTVASSPINGAQGFLDMQHIVLPTVFATQTLTSIQVIDSGAPGLQRTILDGVTIATSGPPPGCGTPVNVRWHYSSGGSAGGWSGTGQCPSNGQISMGPQAMEGDLKVPPGQTINVGYDFTMPGNKSAQTVTFGDAQVVFSNVKCASGATPSASSFTVTMPNQTYTVTNSAWYPSGVQSSPLVYQGSIAAPALCGAGSLRLQQGGTFSAMVSAT